MVCQTYAIAGLVMASRTEMQQRTWAWEWRGRSVVLDVGPTLATFSTLKTWAQITIASTGFAWCHLVESWVRCAPPLRNLGTHC